MEEFKSNSNCLKEQQTPERKAEPLAIAPVKVHKESSVSKFGKKIFTEDAKSVGSSLMDDVVIPGIKNFISNLIKTGVDAFIYGAKGSSRPSNGLGTVYTSYSSGVRQVSNTNSNYSRPTQYSVQDISFETRADAEEVLIAMNGSIERYGMVSVGDFYDMISQKCSYTDQKYGWKDLSGAEVVRVRDGFSIRFPRVIPLD